MQDGVCWEGHPPTWPKIQRRWGRESQKVLLDRMAESECSGERLLQAARRVSVANQFAGGTHVAGKKKKSDCQVPFFIAFIKWLLNFPATSALRDSLKEVRLIQSFARSDWSRKQGLYL